MFAVTQAWSAIRSSVWTAEGRGWQKETVPHLARVVRAESGRSSSGKSELCSVAASCNQQVQADCTTATHGPP